MDMAIIIGIVRHILTGAGMALVSKGVMDTSMVEQAVGALITLGSVGWFLFTRLRNPPPK